MKQYTATTNDDGVRLSRFCAERDPRFSHQPFCTREKNRKRHFPGQRHS